jgi:hypothetical protein
LFALLVFFALQRFFLSIISTAAVVASLQDGFELCAILLAPAPLLICFIFFKPAFVFVSITFDLLPISAAFYLLISFFLSTADFHLVHLLCFLLRSFYCF